MNNWKYIFVVYITLELILTILLPANSSVTAINYIFPIVFIALLFHYQKVKAFRQTIILFLTFCAFQLLINWSYSPFSFSEIFWSLQYLKIVTIFWSALYVWNNHRRTALYLLDFAFISLVLINTLQLMELEWVIDFYSPSANYKKELLFSVMDSRVFGSFLNPNNNALALLLFTVMYLFSKKRLKWSFVAIGAILVFMTQSRTAFLLLILSGLIFVLLNNKKDSKRIALITISSIALLFFVLFFVKFDYMMMLLDGRIFVSNSFITRTEAIQAVIEINKNDIWIGQGKISNIPDLIGFSIDNQYMYVYLEYGLLGVLSLLTIVFYPMIYAIKSRNTKVLIILLILVFAGISNLSFSNGELFAIYSFLLAGAFCLPEKIQQQ